MIARMQNLEATVNGTRIREARLAADMSRADLANEIRTSERNIARWEAGQNQPRVASVALIATATGHDIDFFLTASSEAEDDEEAAALTLDDYLRVQIRRIIREEQQS